MAQDRRDHFSHTRLIVSAHRPVAPSTEVCVPMCVGHNRVIMPFIMHEEVGKKGRGTGKGEEERDKGMKGERKKGRK